MVKSEYVKIKKGHSLVLWILFGWVLMYIPVIYFSFSPNHYWRAF